MVTDADLDERSTIDPRAHRQSRQRHDPGRCSGNRAARSAIDGARRYPRSREGVIYADGVRGVLTAAEGADPAPPLAHLHAAGRPALSPCTAGDRRTGRLRRYLGAAGLPARRPLPRRCRPAWCGDRLPHPDHDAAQGGARRAPEPDIEAGHRRLSADRHGRAGGRRRSTPRSSPTSATLAPTSSARTESSPTRCGAWRSSASRDTRPAPDRIALAWSKENAAEIAPADVQPEDLRARQQGLRVLLADHRKSYSGVFANAADAKLSAFVDDLATAPGPPTDHDGSDWPFVRRWDGYRRDRPAGSAVSSQLGGGFTIAIAGSEVTLTRHRLRGDARPRRQLRGARRLLAGRTPPLRAPRTSASAWSSDTPVGILHHYCTLLTGRMASRSSP